MTNFQYQTRRFDKDSVSEKIKFSYFELSLVCFIKCDSSSLTDTAMANHPTIMKEKKTSLNSISIRMQGLNPQKEL